MPEDKKFMSREEAAHVLGCSLPTIARRTADGSLPFAKFGRRVLIPVEAVARMERRALGEG